MLPNGNMSLPILRGKEPGFVRPHKTEPDWQGMHEPWCTSDGHGAIGNLSPETAVVGWQVPMTACAASRHSFDALPARSERESSGGAGVS